MEIPLKPFLTYEEQIEKLRSPDKGLIITDDFLAKKLLRKISYFSLISGYKSPFKQNDNHYKKGTRLEDIFALYTFDDNLRYILLKYILIVENHIKSLMSYTFTEQFGASQQQYLIATNYDYSDAIKQNQINLLIIKLTEIISPPYDVRYIRHQAEKYGNVPLWVTIKAMTFGSVSKMYSLFTQSMQSKISKHFEGINESDLKRMLDLISRFRNVCAHNERLYCYKYNRGSINDCALHQKLSVAKNKNGQFKYGKSDLFALIISLKYLLDDEEFDEMNKKIICEVDSLFKKTNQIQMNQLLKYMGFPLNWKEINETEITDSRPMLTI